MSEVEKLRQRIALECQAMHRLMYDFAAVSRHEIIAHHYDAIGAYQNQLELLVGNVEASLITAETYIKAIEAPGLQP
ncbi:hypothetical protein [Dictyobacter aurantiacus]|uniref:Uncharacterized protein n=1 Tax=Dictyobacter aurantiacus TaxID=1936993 RepID=A0A401ZNJ9_9CHLR|nr:hypothetical protein [Dictyobacter aurantiacus]GCE08384.1 hypothetical protein KDAU_57130 [Dictyobacter aurantiacus]